MQYFHLFCLIFSGKKLKKRLELRKMCEKSMKKPPKMQNKNNFLPSLRNVWKKHELLRSSKYELRWIVDIHFKERGTEWNVTFEWNQNKIELKWKVELKGSGDYLKRINHSYMGYHLWLLFYWAHFFSDTSMKSGKLILNEII